MGLCINVCIPSLMHLFIYPSIQQFFFSTCLAVLFIEGLKTGEILGNA